MNKNGIADIQLQTFESSLDDFRPISQLNDTLVIQTGSISIPVNETHW